MSDSMGDLLYERKFNEMQMYIPFLTRVINKLKNNEQDKPRKAQLEKMKMLHGLLSNNQKKLKIETLLKCESVLKKLHAKIEKSDEVSPLRAPTKTSATDIQSHTSSSERSPRSPLSSPLEKNSTRVSNSIETNTCPASPTQFGDIDFRPPVEIPTERRCSPLRTGGHWDRPMSNRSPVDFGRNPGSAGVSGKQRPERLPERQSSGGSRWIPASDSYGLSSHHNKSWSSSTSASSEPPSYRRSEGQQRYDPKQKESSEEENWDDPEDELPAKPQPPPPPQRQPPPPQSHPPVKHVSNSPSSPVAVPTSSSHNKHRESTHGIHHHQHHQHRHHEKSNKHIHNQLPQTFNPLPDISLEQKKLYHDTIFKYKKPDPPAPAFNPFTNPLAPEHGVHSPSGNNIFNRLGDKVDGNYENFRIQVKNDKMKQKLSKPPPLPSIQLPPALPIKPIDEVLKSPPLSADDIDDLLNESLEAANEKVNLPNLTDGVNDVKTSALDVVRKKLAMISKAPPAGLESPPAIAKADLEEKEPFYRRGHTPIKKSMEPHSKVQQVDTFSTTSNLPLSISEPSPQSPPNAMDPAHGRLALKYHPHRRCDSTSQDFNKPEIQSPSYMPEPAMPAERLALKYNPHPRRDSLTTTLRTADPRISKAMSQASPLIVPPVATAPIPNVLPTINPYDPRLRNVSRHTTIEPLPANPFCAPIPQYPAAIPSLLEIKVGNPLTGPSNPKPHFGIPANRVDPRTQKLPSTVYAEKFNPERNDQTERMKYLESKKKKLPEPKTYGEYKQSKSRQLAAEKPTKPIETEQEPTAMVSGLSTAPSTLDKMYRNMDYGKELGKSIQGFKIPKKPKPEEVKPESKADEQKTNDYDKKTADEQTKKAEEAEKIDDKADEKAEKKNEETSKKDEKSDDKSSKKKELSKLVAESNEEDVTDKLMEGENNKEADQSAKKILEPLKESKIKHEETVENRDESGEAVNRPGPEGAQVVGENKERDSPLTLTRRGRGRPKTIKAESAKKTDEKNTEPAEEEEEIKPRRIRTRRSTVFKDDDDESQSESKDDNSAGSITPCRSPSDIFGPSTDNSIVSTQNIISGKRRTRASINFNEKAVKKTPVNSPASAKISPKSAQKTSAKKTVVQAKKGRGKRVSDSGQICAVSSTTSQAGDAEDSHNESIDVVNEATTREEPSSSGSKVQTPAVMDADENQKKQEWLEGFLKSIVDPSTNKDRILDMLKAVLDEKKLQQVKDILYSTDDTQDTGEASAVSKKQETNKARPTRTKKNELDRLNDDIRDMFICQGVVTATGRRMCTLAKDAPKEKLPKQKEPQKDKKPKEPQTLPKETAKPQKSAELSLLSANDPKKHIRKAKVTIKPINLRALRSRTQRQSPTREMPVLEPNTPIKLPEEKDTDGTESDNSATIVAKTNRRRPVPKSKRPSTTLALESDEDEDDLELVHLKKKIKMKDEEVEEVLKNKPENPKDSKELVKAEEILTVECTEIEENLEKATPESKEPEQLAPVERVILSEELAIKNVNPEWHTMSDYASCCVICKEKARFIAPHYLTAHNNSEIYTSRLPPSVLEDIKQGIGNRALYSISKKPNLNAFHYRCPFCDFQATNTLRGWMEHFTIHTGEYQYKCSACYKAMNGCTHLLEHIKKYCPDAKRINREPINLRGHTISGYVCHLCNFIQMLHSGVVKHLEVHHGYKDEKSIASIIKIQLIESAGVPKMEENPETKQIVAEPILGPPPAPAAPSKESEQPRVRESNMEVFLSRELASPTSDVLTERLKSIDQDEGITSDSSVNINSQFNDGPAPAPRMTIAERLSQRFKNIEKQNSLLDDARTNDSSTPVQIDEQSLAASQESNEEAAPTPMEVEFAAPAPSSSVEETPSAEIETPQATNTVVSSQSVDTSSLNESGNLVIDEEADGKSTADESESEEPDDVDEDDNENWEDIEITETKGTLPKDKNKNKSIFQTLSRLYASIAPKKANRKAKEKKKLSNAQLAANSEKSQNEITTELALPVAAPSPTPSSEPALVEESTSAQETTTAQPAQNVPPQISNLSDLLPESPSDSLDMLLETNFNCLEGDGTSFPHLDLNDLESPIFLMPEDQSNLQDAIAMATDMDQIKYDVLGDTIPTAANQTVAVTSPPPKQVSSTGVQRIGNVGFSLSKDSVKYYCMVAACTFLFSDHPDGLQNHFLLEHPTLKWNGYCNTCQAQVCDDGSREIQHMLDAHANTTTTDEVVEKPRIKFRRLTGDILSIDKKTPANTPPPPEPVKEKEPMSETPQLSLTSLLQSEPRAMIPPTPPVGFEADIPLYKNVSKEFTITGVAEGVTEDDLRNLVINKAGPASGGMQISQVVSLNAGAKSTSTTSFADIPFEHTNASLLNVLQFPPEIPLPRKSPVSTQVDPLASESNASSLNATATKQAPFQCCVKNCKFVSFMRSGMHDHIEFHLRTDKDRTALNCHECGFEGLHTTDYFRHMAQGHNTDKPAQAATTNELTQKIQDILRSSASGGNHAEDEPERDPLEIGGGSKSLEQRIIDVAEEITSETGLSDDDVWKCPFTHECTARVTEKDFQAHITKHLTGLGSNTPSGVAIQCPHCKLSYQRPALMRTHMKTHSRHRYFCYVCCNTFFNYQQSQKHFSEAHSRTSHVQVQALLSEKTASTRPFFVFSLEKLTTLEVLQFGEKLLVEWERKKASTKTHFQPQERYLLPLQPIFNNQVYCSVCNYKTKVRTNMFRHLQLHIQEVDVASVDPVNPVPCLEKNEKHFDKMLNLACSSNATGTAAKPKDALGTVKIPGFVPDMRRYVCGHPGCTYLTITDNMLRSHLNALHGGEKGYQCPHCQEDICKKTMCAERIVQHLRFHGPKIYQCGECEYLHYTKHVVERHINDKHSTVPSTNMITYDRTETEVNKSMQVIMGKGVPAGQVAETEPSEGTANPAAPQGTKFKWECALCKFQTMTWNQMISHVNSVHRAKHQYHCVHCTFGSAHLAHIMEHIDAKHPSKTREAKYLFYKINETPQDKAADTRPLWTRDDPKRVRSIRGILMENEEDAERTKRNLSKSGIDLDDEDDDVEFVQIIEPEAATQPRVLGCFHCDFKSEEMSAIAGHWRSAHWHVKNGELVPKLPFFFRILSVLKCPSCAFVGDFLTLQQHALSRHGQRSFSAADPKLPFTCGHCPFVYPPKRLELLIRHYFREHRPSDVKNLSTNSLKNVLALGECQVYMQCYFCAEICADKAAIIEHERDRHGSSNFRYKQIKDEVIYRCGMCQYSSTNEMATLRHMVDHFGGFSHCHFCIKEQGGFNAYMQHCYVSHPKELKKFKEIYTLAEMTTFLGQMLLIFPNGLIVNKRNLVHTQYGSTERINAMYDEICKKALEPPIPPLCMARLIAKRSFEGSEGKAPLPPPGAMAARKIAKRRSTVAMGSDEIDDVLPAKVRKRKSSITADDQNEVQAEPLFSTITTSNTTKASKSEANSDATETKDEVVGVSFYGKKSEPLDLSRIYTQIAIADKYAPVSVKKFSLLFKINTKVVVEKMDLSMYQSPKKSRSKCRPCPASKKWKHV